jgi:hypothetical protein
MRKLWIVTKPTKDSVIEDIIFNADAKELELQFKGGLKGEEISNWTFDEGIAHKEAHDLLISPETNEGIESKIKELISANKSDEEIINMILALDKDREMRLKKLNKKSDKNISMEEAEEESKLYKQKRKEKIDYAIQDLELLLDKEFYPEHIGHTEVFTNLTYLKNAINENI